MADRFPHLKDSEFPNVGNVDVYKYANEFDYTRYNDLQMQIQMCNVPWDMGEAHIGNRTISGIGNVVYFGTKAKRDAWFAAIPDTECYRFETKFKELHRSNQIDVPIPFDVASKYNYLAIDYALFANDSSLVEYEKPDGLRRWFWFIREVEFLAPNTTRLHLMPDAWQTFIYDLDVAGMILERGHAPMVQTNAATYLANPVARSQNLLATDIVNDNATDLAYAAGELVFNAGNMKAVIITTANPVTGTWGTKAGDTWQTAGERHFTIDGVPAYCAFALNAANLSTFLTNVSSSVPQFMQTIQGVCFVSSDMLTLGTSFTFASVSCNMVSSGYKKNTVLTLNKSIFGYPQAYDDIAKLYTYPYAYIQLSDDTGATTDIRIEQTDGKIEYESCINLVYPWLQINGHVSSKGRGTKRAISFSNITERSINIKGDWYNTLSTWNIPMFGVTQDAGEYNDYATHFDRKQQQTAATNEQTSANASADTKQTNANASANTEESNANANASTAVSIGNLQIAANNAITSANTTKVNADYSADYTLNYDDKNSANVLIYGTTNNDILAADQRASIAANAAYNQAGLGAVTSILSGNIMGAVGSIAGGSIEVGSIMANNSVSVNQSSSQAGLQQSYNTATADHASTAEYTKSGNTITNATSIRDANNSLTTGSTAATAATLNANAARTNTTATANATRDNTTEKANATRAYNTATSAITNQVAQANLEAPRKFGDSISGDTATTRPMGLFADIVTQDPYSIAYAGDEMLRYGYMFNRQWSFNGNWNVSKCKYFSYWKLADFWVSNLSIPDMYVDRLRFFLYGGVTVWRDPAYIGHKGIYDNIDWS